MSLPRGVMGGKGTLSDAEMRYIAGGFYRSDICPDCGVGVGDCHEPGCDVERCSNCAGQRCSCSCVHHDPELSVWIGTWPGEVTAFALGWYSRFAADGWVECSLGAAGAGPDLNRVAVHQMSRMLPLRRT